MDSDNLICVDELDAFLLELDGEDWASESAGFPLNTDSTSTEGLREVERAEEKKEENANGKVTAFRANAASQIVAKIRQKKSAPAAEKTKLIVFPSFEKCDSLVFFPHTLSRLVNCNDKPSLVRMFNHYFDKSCEAHIQGAGFNIDCSHKRLLDMTSLVWDANSDFFMCVHDTKVVGNMISAVIYYKYTECKYLTDSVRQVTTDPLLLDMLTSPGEQLKRELHFEEKTENEQKEISDLIDSGQDLHVYGRMDIKMRIDDVSKKIIALDLGMYLTSLAPHSGKH